VPELRVGHILAGSGQTSAVWPAHDKESVAVILPRSGFDEHDHLELQAATPGTRWGAAIL